MDGHAASTIDNADVVADSFSTLALYESQRSYKLWMPCGVHKRPHWVPEKPPRDVFSRNVKQRYRRKVREGEKRGSCLCDYYDFPELLLERRKDVSHVKKQFDFMSLPAELRLVIYEHMFTYESLEFCPVPCAFPMTDLDERVQKDGKPSQFTAPKAAHKVQTSFLQDNLKSFGGLLRANKQVSKEALPILYTKNEFRFTNIIGWSALDTFMCQIGMENCAMLRRVTVCHPEFLDQPYTRRHEGHFWEAMVRGPAHGRKVPFCFHYKRWYEKKVWISPDPVLVLERLGKLEDLCLVLGEDCDSVYPSPVDMSKFEDLKVTFASIKRNFDHLVRLYISGGPDWRLGPTPAAERSPDGKSWAQEIVARAGNSRWYWEEIVVNRDGDYKRLGGSQKDPDPRVAEA